MDRQKNIWTIGHSTRTIETFISMLQSFDISFLADIRNYPGSKRYPQYNKENLEQSLKDNNITYQHFKELGGRRKPVVNSINTAWRNSAFRGYADYMEAETFQRSAEELQHVAEKYRTVYMCSEAVWWSCHRSLLSDYLKIRDWNVYHIMDVGKATEHPFTKAARIENGELHYDEPDLFLKNTQ
jgi:uncharacterized protein (DUF488 family)